MTGDLEPYQPAPTPEAAWSALLAPAAFLAEKIAGTEFVPKGMRGRPPVVLAAIMYGHALGIHPMHALASIDVVDGRPEPNAELKRALVLAAGHELWIEEAGDTRAKVSGRRAGTSRVQTVTWTMDDARRANLAGRGPWKTYPRRMLIARATSELCRDMFPDVIRGLGEDAELDTGPDTPAVEAAAAPAGRKTRRPDKQPPAAPSPEPAAIDAAEAPQEPVSGPDSGDDTPVGPDLPDPESEPGSEPQRAADDRLMTDAQARKLMVGFRNAGVESRADRLTLTSRHLGRVLATSRELTRDEATIMIDGLELVGTGDLVVAWDDDGPLLVLPTEPAGNSDPEVEGDPDPAPDGQP
jgi:hypothetical protein